MWCQMPGDRFDTSLRVIYVTLCKWSCTAVRTILTYHDSFSQPRSTGHHVGLPFSSFSFVDYTRRVCKLHRPTTKRNWIINFLWSKHWRWVWHRVLRQGDIRREASRVSGPFALSLVLFSFPSAAIAGGTELVRKQNPKWKSKRHRRRVLKAMLFFTRDTPVLNANLVQMPTNSWTLVPL